MSRDGDRTGHPELGLPLSPALAAGPNRRAVFHDPNDDIAFLANWTSLVHSRDIDTVVEAARAVARNQNVFLGGHSAGTGFTARYAATDFDLTGSGPAEPGYAKLRGLVLLEGGGGSAADPNFTDDSLDRIEDRADGALFHAVRTQTPRCVDGTPCAVATEAVDCAGKGNETCTPPTGAYAIVPGLLNPRILASAEVVSIQGMTDPDTGEAILGVDQGAPGNNAVDVVPDLNVLNILGATTVHGGLGTFLDDDGLVSSFATFVRTSVGAPGPVVNGLTTWRDISEGPFGPTVLPDNGPPPVALPASVWGQEKEVSSLPRIVPLFFSGATNFTDWYYPSAGLATTSAPGVCTAGLCTAGSVGASCTTDAECTETVSLDSTALSVGRGRRDIENLTQAANVNIPVICFGGSNGLTPVPGNYTAFGTSIGTCTAPSCDGTTPRVVAVDPNADAFPTLGGVAGGFEVHISEGFAHLDIVTAEDGPDNAVVGPLVDFLERNLE